MSLILIRIVTSENVQKCSELLCNVHIGTNNKTCLAKNIIFCIDKKLQKAFLPLVYSCFYFDKQNETKCDRNRLMDRMGSRDKEVMLRNRLKFCKSLPADWIHGPPGSPVVLISGLLHFVFLPEPSEILVQFCVRSCSDFVSRAWTFYRTNTCESFSCDQSKIK